MSVRLPAHHVAVIACWSAPHRPAALLLCLLFITVMNSSQPLSFFFVDLINQSLISCGDLFFLITTVSFRAGGPWAFCRFFFFFQKQPIKEATPAGTLNHGTPSPGQSAIGGDGVRATCRASSQTRRSKLNWQRTQRWEECVWLFGCPAV